MARNPPGNDPAQEFAQRARGAPTSAGRGPVYQPMQRLVRNWQEVSSTPPVREPQVPDVQRPEAFIEWGKASEFASDSFRSDAKSIGFRVDDDEEPERVRHVLSEEGRGWLDFVIPSFDDPEAFIVLRQATLMAFSGPGGDQFRFDLASPVPPATQSGSGQTPPSPDLDEM